VSCANVSVPAPVVVTPAETTVENTGILAATGNNIVVLPVATELPHFMSIPDGRYAHPGVLFAGAGFVLRIDADIGNVTPDDLVI